MGIGLATLFLFGGMIVLLALGVRVVFALGGVSVLFLFLLGGPQDLYMVATTTYREITDSALITIPLFLLMGNFLIHSGISDRLFQALNYWLGGIRGSLALVAIGVCVALAMCGGFGPGILTMGLIAVPAMLKQNYDKRLALGCVMAGGVLGEIIPPSIIMIIFGYLTRISVAKIFFAGTVPGFITAGLYITFILVRCYLNPDLAPKAREKVTWAMRWNTVLDIALPSLLVLTVLGSIFFGVATPTEASGVGAMGAAIICLVYGKLNWKVVTDSCRQTLLISGMALWILIAATLFGVVYTNAGAQGLILSLVQDLQVSRWIILIVMQIILLIMGCFMDDYAVMTICAPIFFPIAVTLGFDPLWFAILFILNMQVAYLSPPFGWALILMRGVAPPEVETKDIWRAVPPWMLMQLAVLILTMIYPRVALWLPDKMY
ncbi:MAG: TRAP transporter large permease subunit [Thermodesulfobacteriota bacterium]